MKSDSQLKQDVLAELKWNAEVDDTKIGVTVTNGALALTGHVPTYRQRNAAKQAVKRVNGVLSLVDGVDVQLESTQRMTDEGLAERIANVLNWNVSIAGNPIKAEVKNGMVTLSGDVETLEEMERVEDAAWAAPGVVKVVDHLRVA